MKRLILIYILFLVATPAFVLRAEIDTSTKKERNLIREGNKHYNDKNFSEAEKFYRKALDENVNSELAAYNLATSLLRQSGSADPNSGNNPIKEASEIFSGLSQSAKDSKIAEYSAYNMGNIAFNQQQYQQSVDSYKKALRLNPDNDKARQNLRIAQLKLQEQQNQQQNQNNKQDNNQNQDQQKRDQNKEQNKNEKQDKDKNDPQQNQGQDKKEQNKEQQQPPRQEQGGISDANAAKILKTMENEENATRRKVNELKKREEQSQKRRTTNQW